MGWSKGEQVLEDVRRCSVCRAVPALVTVETNGLFASAAMLCGDCFSHRFRAQRARRVTPLSGVPPYVKRPLGQAR